MVGRLLTCIEDCPAATPPLPEPRPCLTSVALFCPSSPCAQMRVMAMFLGLMAAEAFNSPAMMPQQRAPALRAASLRMETPAPEKAADAETEEAAPPAPPAVEYSEALPFLTRRASLGPKGALVGDVGFDPLGFTEIFPLVRALFLAPVPPDHSRTPLSKQRARKFRRGCSGDGGASACSTSSARHFFLVGSGDCGVQPAEARGRGPERAAPGGGRSHAGRRVAEAAGLGAVQQAAVEQLGWIRPLSPLSACRAAACHTQC